MIGCLQPLNLPDLPVEFFDAASKCRASFRQIRKVLLPRKQALIPSDLAFRFRDLDIRFALPLLQSLNLGQERFPTGFRCLKLQQPLLPHSLLGFQGLKTG
jgi:hypothetical protein